MYGSPQSRQTMFMMTESLSSPISTHKTNNRAAHENQILQPGMHNGLNSIIPHSSFHVSPTPIPQREYSQQDSYNLPLVAPPSGQQVASFSDVQVVQASRNQSQTPVSTQNGYVQAPGLTLGHVPGLQQLLEKPVVLTPPQMELLKQRLQQQKCGTSFKQTWGMLLARVVPANGGNLHSVAQYEHTFRMAKGYQQLLTDKAAQQSRQQQSMDQPSHSPGQSSQAPPQLRPYGYQTHPSQRSQQLPTNVDTQEDRSNAVLTSSVGSRPGQYMGIACTNCHEMWANTWCDDGDPCENCSSSGAKCRRPACEHADVPQAQCPKQRRCNRAHSDRQWTLAEYRKDLKRKGKQGDAREPPAKKKRIEGSQ
jgi:hypothetical protein